MYQTEVAIACFFTTTSLLYLWHSALMDARLQPPLGPAALKASDIIDHLRHLITEFQNDPDSSNLVELQQSFKEYFALNMNDKQYLGILPKSRMFKAGLDVVFNAWYEKHDAFRNKIEKLPKLTVTTATTWKTMASEILKYEIKSADYDQLYGFVIQDDNASLFAPRAIKLQKALDAMAAKSLPPFPDQFPEHVVVDQIKVWCDQIRDLTLNPNLKRIAIDAAESKLKQMDRRRLLLSE